MAAAVHKTDWWLRNIGILAWQYRHIQVDEQIDMMCMYSSKKGCLYDAGSNVMRQWWHGQKDDVDVTVCFNCKSKLVLLLRLGYLKPFLAGSKKTKQGPGWRVGALCISRCWFYLTVVAGPKLIQKDYKIIWCCVFLCYGSWWFKCLWYVNDEVKDVYEMIMRLVE